MHTSTATKQSRSQTRSESGFQFISLLETKIIGPCAHSQQHGTQ